MLDKFSGGASASSTAITPPGGEIIIVDDEPIIGDLLDQVFSSEGYQVTTFSDGEAFNAVARLRGAANLRGSRFPDAASIGA